MKVSQKKKKKKSRQKVPVLTVILVENKSDRCIKAEDEDSWLSGSWNLSA